MADKSTQGTAAVADQALSEREKMIEGLPYLAVNDPQLVQERLRVRPLCQKYNSFPWPAVPADKNNMPDYFGPCERREILAEIFGVSVEKIEKDVFIEPPFFCDYGTNIDFRGSFYCNFNCHFLDCAKISLGHRVLFGPNVHLYAATHSTEVEERKASLERAYPITIGDDVWIGGGAIVIGPCTIGNGVTVAAGAVVTGNVPDNVVMGGVPAKIIKRLDDKPLVESITKDKPNGKALNDRLGSPRLEDGAPKADGTFSKTKKPFLVNPTTECFLANVPPRVAVSTLRAALSQYGEVQKLHVDKKRRLGFVRFANADGASMAVAAGRSKQGLVIDEQGTVIGVEHRRSHGAAKSFNADLVTSTQCTLKGIPEGVDDATVKTVLGAACGGRVKSLTRETGAASGKAIVHFEELSAAREGVRLSQAVENGGKGGIEVVGGTVKVEAKKTFHSGKRRPMAEQDSGARHKDGVTQDV